MNRAEKRGASMQSGTDVNKLAGFGNWQVFSVLILDNEEEEMRSFLERSLKSHCGLVEAVGDLA
jgi:hypothetical protein